MIKMFTNFALGKHSITTRLFTLALNRAVDHLVRNWVWTGSRQVEVSLETKNFCQETKEKVKEHLECQYGNPSSSSPLSTQFFKLRVYSEPELELTYSSQGSRGSQSLTETCQAFHFHVISGHSLNAHLPYKKRCSAVGKSGCLMHSESKFCVKVAPRPLKL